MKTAMKAKTLYLNFQFFSGSLNYRKFEDLKFLMLQQSLLSGGTVNRYRFFVIATFVVLLASCASIGDSFLLLGIPDTEKASALSRAGVAKYNIELIKEGNLSSIDAARKMFQAALRYDPANADATRYLVLLDDYRAKEFSSSLSIYKTLAAKKTRSADEEHRMHVAVRRAMDLDPKSKEAQAIFKETTESRLALLQKYFDDIDGKVNAVTEKSTEAFTEKSYIEAFLVASKAREIDPAHKQVKASIDRLNKEILGIIESRLAKLPGYYNRAEFTNAKGQIDLMADLNEKTGFSFTDRIVSARYDLYLRWAQWHEARKEWASAISRANSALAYKRTTEAQNLIKRVTDKRDAEEKGASFDAALKNLDEQLQKGDLLEAQRLLSSLGQTASGDSQRSLLEERRKKILAALPAIYQKGVTAYRDENFKDAITYLEVVTGIDPAYEQAMDFLDKARSKQAVLDQF